MRASRALAGFLALALLAVGCGDDDDAAIRGTDATDPAAAGADGGSVGSEGCGADPAFGAGFSEQTIDSGDQPRTYRLHVPAAHDGRTPVPLLLSLGGYSTNAELQEEISDYEDLGEAEGFAVATPDPLTPRGWEAGPGSYDVDFMADLMDSLGDGLCLDRARTYASGMSLGALFASRLACDLGDRLAAIGPVAGLAFPGGCDPGRPMPVLGVHGTVDSLFAFDESLQAAAAWAEHNGCSGESVDEPVSEHVVTQVYEEGCAAPVEFWVVNGGGHSWPGDDFLGTASPGATTMEIDASQVIWDFLQQYSLPSAG